MRKKAEAQGSTARAATRWRRGCFSEFPHVHFAPVGWAVDDANPFDGGAFGPDWTGLFLGSGCTDKFWNGTSQSNLYSVVFSRHVQDLPQRVYDFLRYELSARRSVVVGTDGPEAPSTRLEAILRTANRLPGIRSTDARYAVHSTTLSSWNAIQRDGCLKSPIAIGASGGTVDPVGRRLLGDPVDYLDYVHFGPYDTLHVEYVVLSRQRGKIVCDPDETYRPGVRIYVDNHRMIEDGLVVRDGLHHSKVRGVQPLDRYMVFSVEADESRGPWTPRAFYEYATGRFNRYIDESSLERRQRNSE